MNAARRAIIYLTVDWSVPERATRVRFSEFVQAFRKRCPGAGISFFTVAEDEEFAARWIASCVPGYDARYPAGSGGVLWLANRRLLQRAYAADAVDLDAVTKEIFSVTPAPEAPLP